MGVLANVFGGSTGQFGTGPSAVTAQSLSSEGFDLTKPFIQDVLEAGRAQFFEDTTDPETGDTIQQLAPFEQFTGPRLADFTSEQQEALTGLAALGRQGLATTPDLSSSAPYFQQAKQQAGLGSLAFTEADADRLMNPFLRGVTDTAKREAIREYEGTIQPKLDNAAVQAGSFGGSRAAILEAEAQRNLQQQLSEIEERGLATAFEQAQRGFESERGRQLQSSALFSGLGEAAPAQAARELALLSSAGEAQQAQEQAALNLAEKDFIEQREFPLRQLQEYQSLVRGFPFTPSTYQVTSRSEPQPSFGQQILGTLGTGVGIFGALGGFKNKAGGQVVPRQSGGQIRGGLAGLERHQNNYNLLNQRPTYPGGKVDSARFRGIVNPMEGRDRTSIFDTVLSLFGKPESVVEQNKKFGLGSGTRLQNQKASDLPPVEEVADADGVMSIVEKPQPKEKSLSDYINMFTNQIPDRETTEARSRILTGRTEQFTDEDDKNVGFKLDRGNYLARVGLAQPADPFGSTAEETSIQNLEDAGVPYYYLDPDIGKSDLVKKAKEQTNAIEKEADVEKTQKIATEKAGVSTSVLEPKRLNNLINKEGTPLSDTYNELDTAFSDYLSFLEKKKGETDVEMAEAQEAREMKLFAEVAATSARFAGQAGPGGFLAKLNQAALPSIAELKNIQSDFRKEMKAAKNIEGDILKDKLNINLAKTKLDMERSKLESENLLRSAKAQAELTADAYGQDAKETVDSLDKAMTGLTVSNEVRAAAFNLQAQLLYKGEDPDKAYAKTMRFVRGQIGVRPGGAAGTKTTKAALNAERKAKEKINQARNRTSQ